MGENMIDKITDLIKYRNDLYQELRTLNNVDQFSVCAIYNQSGKTHDFMLTKNSTCERTDADELIRNALYTYYTKEISRVDMLLEKHLADN